MASTINGNVGGAAASGAQVQCVNVATKAISYAAADGSGNYSIPSLAAGTYIISASLATKQYLASKSVVADGATTYSDVNLNPIALNASNAQQPSSF
jgi:carboxypeptidase family protein